MGVFENVHFDNHEDIVFINDADTGLHGIIAIHKTTLGPAVGGLRFWDYRCEQEALDDVLRLSKGMSYKNAMAKLPFGGGKAVILFNPLNSKSPELLHAIGRKIEQFKGRYVTGEDVGSTTEDMGQIKTVTDHVLGYSSAEGGSGNPSSSTALGCFVGIKASVKHVFGTEDLTGLRVAVQGVGNVGMNLCKLLSKAGADLIVSDINNSRSEACHKRFGATVVQPIEILSVETDVFSPCAMGAVINDEMLPSFKSRIVAGAANNQLENESLGESLHERGILYAPDYVINAGGVIQFSFERAAFLEGEVFDSRLSDAKVMSIYDTLLSIYEKAVMEGISTQVASDLMAQEILRQ